MTRKILASLLVIVAVVAAVAGLTFAVFSDNISSDKQYFTAGTVDIQVEDVDQFFDTTLDMDNMEPGDCSTQTVTIANVGTLPVYLWNWIYPSGPIFSCDPNANCNMDVHKTFVADSGPTIDGPEKIEPGESEDWELEACLPLCAGNNCQAQSGYVRIFFHAVQQSNLDGYECVKLEDKASPDWMPDPITPPHGNVCYRAEDTGTNGLTDALHIIVNAYGLTGDADFQLALDGGDTNDSEDPACQPQDAALAAMSTDLFVAGYWNWGTNLEASCIATNGGEGVWNYAGVYGGVHSDGTGVADGAISYEAYLTGLAPMDYVVKANVKEIGGLPPFPGTSWTGVLSGLDYLRFTIDE